MDEKATDPATMAGDNPPPAYEDLVSQNHENASTGEDVAPAPMKDQLSLPPMYKGKGKARAIQEQHVDLPEPTDELENDLAQARHRSLQDASASYTQHAGPSNPAPSTEHLQRDLELWQSSPLVLAEIKGSPGPLFPRRAIQRSSSKGSPISPLTINKTQSVPPYHEDTLVDLTLDEASQRRVSFPDQPVVDVRTFQRKSTPMTPDIRGDSSSEEASSEEDTDEVYGEDGNGKNEDKAKPKGFLGFTRYALVEALRAVWDSYMWDERAMWDDTNLRQSHMHSSSSGSFSGPDGSNKGTGERYGSNDGPSTASDQTLRDTAGQTVKYVFNRACFDWLLTPERPTHIQQTGCPGADAERLTAKSERQRSAHVAKASSDIGFQHENVPSAQSVVQRSSDTSEPPNVILERRVSVQVIEIDSDEDDEDNQEETEVDVFSTSVGATEPRSTHPVLLAFQRLVDLSEEQVRDDQSQTHVQRGRPVTLELGRSTLFQRRQLSTSSVRTVVRDSERTTGAQETIGSDVPLTEPTLPPDGNAKSTLQALLPPTSVATPRPGSRIATERARTPGPDIASRHDSLDTRESQDEGRKVARLTICDDHGQSLATSSTSPGAMRIPRHSEGSPHEDRRAPTPAEMEEAAAKRREDKVLAALTPEKRQQVLEHQARRRRSSSGSSHEAREISFPQEYRGRQPSEPISPMSTRPELAANSASATGGSRSPTPKPSPSKSTSVVLQDSRAFFELAPDIVDEVLSEMSDLQRVESHEGGIRYDTDDHTPLPQVSQPHKHDGSDDAGIFMEHSQGSPVSKIVECTGTDRSTAVFLLRKSGNEINRAINMILDETQGVEPERPSVEDRSFWRSNPPTGATEQASDTTSPTEEFIRRAIAQQKSREAFRPKTKEQHCRGSMSLNMPETLEWEDQAVSRA